MSFDQAVADAAKGLPDVASRTDFSVGKPFATSNQLDLAISGSGFFTVRRGDELLYTRDGQFKRDDQNRIVTQGGLPVQLQGGGDLSVQSDDLKVLADGTVTDSGEPVGKLALAKFEDTAALADAEGGLFSADAAKAADAKDATVQQGSLEGSNSAMGDEMTSIMQALRSAQTAQRLVGVYDDLLGRTITAFGQS